MDQVKATVVQATVEVRTTAEAIQTTVTVEVNLATRVSQNTDPLTAVRAILPISPDGNDALQEMLMAGNGYVNLFKLHVNKVRKMLFSIYYVLFP